MLQKKFDDFKTDLQANEVRLAEMNEIAMQLMSLGQTEAALKIQTQIEELNTKWNSLQQMAQVRNCGLFFYCNAEEKGKKIAHSLMWICITDFHQYILIFHSIA